MQLRVFIDPQRGETYDDQLRWAQAAERCGFEGFFRSDHYLPLIDDPMPQPDGLPGPTDAWMTLAALARETSRIRLGTLVSPVTFRHPSALAIQVAQADTMSGGRIELGLGAGWYEAEHRAYGIPFPSQRFDMLEEQLAVITGLWSTPAVGERFDFAGSRYTLADSPGSLMPAQDRIPVIVGGSGPRRTPALAARFASEYNCNLRAGRKVSDHYAVVRTACADIGRDPGELVYSATAIIACGRDDTEVKRRAAALGRDPADMSAACLVGTPAEIVEQLNRLSEFGAERVYLCFLDLSDLDHLELVAAEVAPHVTA